MRQVKVGEETVNPLEFGKQYGEIIIACDSKNYWRKEVFPFYKKHRKKDREESGFDWKAIFDTLDTIRDELEKFFPYKVLCIEGAEADDIIAVMAKYSQQNFNHNPLFAEPEDFLIISGDHDFVQLQKYSNVKQYSSTKKNFVVSDSTPERALLEHTIRGDKGDGIPNVLSPDESVYENIRQRPISSKKITEWLDPKNRPTDLEFQTRWIRNQTLIDFNYIPEDIEQKILNSYLNMPHRDRSQLFNYFIHYKMKNMMEVIEEF